MAKIDTDGNGSMHLDSKLFLEVEKFRPHQVHLEGGDASSDSCCFS
jgi:methanethiol oxidase